MSKKFKLIKEYPGSLKLGEILEFNEKGVLINHAILDKYRWLLPTIETCENKEYFKEIIEQTYEILEYFKETKIESAYSVYGWLTLDSLVKTDIIKSVKRLPDGEIFSVGDTYVYEAINYVDPKPREIVKISIKDTGSEKYVWLHDDLNNLAYGSNLENVKKINKKQQPLFVTEDDVEIFEGDNWWVVYDDTVEQNEWHWKILSKNDPKHSFSKLKMGLKGIHIFSTEELAKDYIELHKPQYSIHDLRIASTSYGFGGCGNFANVNVDLLITNKLNKK